ncbi:hypothetical protein N9V16_03795 [SAR116 cluster bacterium]|nr:hypothetical protein [SAR116 cluster bacterium]
MTLEDQIEQTVLRRYLEYLRKKQRINSTRLLQEFRDVRDINTTVETIATLKQSFNQSPREVKI